MTNISLSYTIQNFTSSQNISHKHRHNQHGFTLETAVCKDYLRELRADDTGSGRFNVSDQ